ILEINRDITERKRSEAAVLEAQKLEGLGLLAGGFAHEFNNILTGILGNASLALECYPNHPASSLLQEVVRAAETGAHLTKQMLAYAGKGRFLMERLEPGELIRQALILAQPNIPRKVTLRLDMATEAPHIEADRSQFQQMLINLVLNAAEAMPDG